jgi:hypothetical protein
MTVDSTRDAFISVEQVIEYFRAMQVDPRVTSSVLGKMLEHGLCLSYDPTVTDIGMAKRVELSPSGFQHLRWGTRDETYISQMLEVTPVTDLAAFDALSELFKQPRGDSWAERGTAFTAFLCAEDARHCRVPSHDAYISQRRLANNLGQVFPATSEREARHHAQGSSALSSATERTST